jgi:hypothetical protein
LWSQFFYKFAIFFGIIVNDYVSTYFWNLSYRIYELKKSGVERKKNLSAIC